MKRVPRSLRRRIRGPLFWLLFVSAGAHAALLAVATEANQATLVHVPPVYMGRNTGCFSARKRRPAPRVATMRFLHRFPVDPAALQADEPADVIAVHNPRRNPTRGSGLGSSADPMLGRLLIEQSVRVIFDRNQADLDDCTGHFADWSRPGTPYDVHIEVEYGRLNPDRIRVKTLQPDLRACLLERIRQWDDWPSSPDHISVDIRRRPRSSY